MKNLYEERCKRLSDQELLLECEQHGRVMEKRACNNELLTKGQKERAILCFTEAASRESLKEDHDLILTALRVLRLL